MGNNLDENVIRQTINTKEYYENIDNLEEVPIDILRTMYKENLSELETYKTLVDKYGGAEELEKYILEISKVLGDIPINVAKTLIEDKNKTIECLTSELEKYKKIADVLVEKLRDLDNKDNTNTDCFIPRKFCNIDKCIKTDCKQCIIDWARKEVENENKN